MQSPVRSCLLFEEWIDENATEKIKVRQQSPSNTIVSALPVSENKNENKKTKKVIL